MPKPDVITLMNKLFYLLTTLVLLMSFNDAQADCATQSDIPISQCDTLVSLYESTNGPNWAANANWLDDSPCIWRGVTCRNGGVERLTLLDNDLAGEIPSLSALVSLEGLSLEHNQLTGPLPDLSGLTELSNINFYGNRFSGPIPELTNLPKLRNLNLGGNRLTGSLPLSIGNLPSLEKLFVNGNDLSGGILTDASLSSTLIWFHFDDSAFCAASKSVLDRLELLENLSGNLDYCLGIEPSVDEYRFASGETVDLFSQTTNSASQETWAVDLYYSLAFPDQQTEAFIVIQDGISQMVYGSTDDSASWEPYGSNVVFQPSHDGVIALVHSFQITEDFPSGTYAWKVRAVKSGTVEVSQEAEAQFSFNADLDVVAPIVSHVNRGLSGFLYMNSEHPDNDNDGAADRVGVIGSYGHSWYSSVFSLTDRHLVGFQVGLGSTIIAPQNEDFFSPLCPPGTSAGDLFTGSAEAFYRGAFQTLEGGIGSWMSSRFPSQTPKFGITGTGYCYTGGFSAPGWGFEDTERGAGERFDRSKRATAQLSNRLLVSPDGITFESDTGGAFLGLAWMALPLIDSREVFFGDNTSSTPVGNNNWTLFFNASNFKGPVLFVLPDEWADLSSTYPVIEGRGFDARPSALFGMLMEFNSVPHFSQQVSPGVSISKIPQLNFPVNHEGNSLIVHSITDYSKDALFNAVGDWFDQKIDTLATEFDSTKILEKECRNGQYEFEHGVENKSFAGLDETVEAYILDDNCSLGLTWNKTPGKFPQYFIEENEQVRVTTEEELNIRSEIFDEEFASVTPGSRGEYDLYNSSCWDESLSVGDSVAYMSDGSAIRYSWFRFIDQPSIRCANLSQVEKDELQRRVELIHANWEITDNYIEPPTIGELARFDDAAIVLPPSGFEVGYVPIIKYQKAPIDTDDDGLADHVDPDDDNDGVEDTNDAFALDPSETADSDNDGVGDNSDAFPFDATESVDSDSDGVGDNGDNCSSLTNADQLNTDGDAEGNACDADDDNDGFSDDQEAIDSTNSLSRFSCKSGCFSFDVDESLKAQPLTDGLLVIRHLFGFSGESLTSGAVSGEAGRDSSENIAGYLTGADSELDIDGDGESKPLTDGLLLIRYLFGFSGDSLISGAIGDGAERDTAEEVEAYIEERVPVQ